VVLYFPPSILSLIMSFVGIKFFEFKPEASKNIQGIDL
jgi:hypothetical protein